MAACASIMMEEKIMIKKKKGGKREEISPEAGYGGLEPPEEDISLDGDHMYSLQAATASEFTNLSESSDVVMDEIERYTDDEDVAQDFAERQQLNTGRDELKERLQQNTAQTPELSGGDIDAAWDDSIVSGEESVGGTSPTPDQDRVDELGAAVGINYADNEPLNTLEKLNRRDRNRLDFSPASNEGAYELADDEGDLNDLLADYLDEDLDEDLKDDDRDDLGDDLEDEFSDEIEDELTDDLDEGDEDAGEDEETDDYDDEEDYVVDEMEGDESEDDIFDDFDEDED